MRLLQLIVILSIVGLVGFSPLAQDSSGQAPEPRAGDEAPDAGADAETPAEPVGADLSEANALVRAGDYAKAEELLAGLQDEFPEDADLLTMRGELLNALQRPEEAIEVLRRAAELDPGRARLHFQLGSALAATGQTDQALEAFGKELEVNDEPQVVALARLNRSFLYQQKREWAAAAAELEALLEAEPARVPVYGDLVVLYLQLDRVDDALDALHRGDSAGFRSARHWQSVAARLYKDQDYERSVEVLKRTIELDPDLADAQRSMAAALEKLGRESEAVPYLRRYLELKPDAEDAEAITAKIRAIAGD